MTNGAKKGQCYALRLPPTVRAELENVANREGISINQFIAMAVAEKIIQFEMHLPAKTTIPSKLLRIRREVPRRSRTHRDRRNRVLRSTPGSSKNLVLR